MVPWAKRVDLAVNIALLCAFVMVTALAAERFWRSDDSQHPAAGTRISLPGADWSKSNENLVLALSTTCHFCSESAEFYRRLVPTAESHGASVFAVLPQSLAASQRYLKALGVSVPQILQSPLESIDVAGTPTLLVVDARGKIRKAWIGKLSGEREREIMETFH
jgi:peroxiredoxin